MAAGSSSPSDSDTSAASSDRQSTSSQSSENTNRRPEKKALLSGPHEYTSLCDLIEFPCTCPLCAFFREWHETGCRPEPGPQFSSGIMTRLALASLLPLPDADPLRRSRSKRPLLRRFLRGLMAISQAFDLLIGAILAAEDEVGASPGRLPFMTS